MSYAESILEMRVNGRMRTFRAHKIIDLIELAEDQTRIIYATGPGHLSAADAMNIERHTVEIAFAELLVRWKAALSAMDEQ